jgi:hypothetical protein
VGNIFVGLRQILFRGRLMSLNENLWGYEKGQPLIQDEKETLTLMMLAVIKQQHQGAARRRAVRTRVCRLCQGFELKG